MSARFINKRLRAHILAGTEPQLFVRHSRYIRLRQGVLATPPWVKRRDFKALVKRRDWLTKQTGIKHTLDHIVPIAHPKVCGLNVPWNIQILTEWENSKKGNRWVDEEESMLSISEQFELFII